MKTARPSRASVVSTILVVLATVAASTAWASPDHCGPVAGGGAICQGNQSNGVVAGQDVAAGTSSITART